MKISVEKTITYFRLHLVLLASNEELSDSSKYIYIYIYIYICVCVCVCVCVYSIEYCEFIEYF